MSSTITRRIVRLERVARAAHDDEMDRDLVARLSPVEREQRLLAIQREVRLSPEAQALLKETLAGLKAPEQPAAEPTPGLVHQPERPRR